MTHNISEAPKPAAAPKLLDRIRLKHDSKRTALAYWGWIKRYSLFQVLSQSFRVSEQRRSFGPPYPASE